MEYIIIVACLAICVSMIMGYNLKKSNETISNLARLREESVKDPRTIFEKTLEDFPNQSLIEDMYITCPSEDCDEQYLRIDKPLHICRACGKRFHDFPLAA